MPQIIQQTGKNKHRPIVSKPRTTSVVDRIKPMTMENDEGLKMLLYGVSGTGKTTLWATFPGPILAIICSGGNRSGELRSIKTPDIVKKVHEVELRNSEEIMTL